jgi:hypothetical protein
MKNPKTKLSIAVGAALVVAVCALAQSSGDQPLPAPSMGDQPDAGNLRAFVELARSDLKTQKALIIAENLPMTDDEAAEFWPVQHDYENELSKLNDLKLALIVRYAQSYQTMSDADATELAKSSFDIEAKKTDLKRKYFKKFSKVMPATKAARFFQIENQLNMVVDLRVAASLPLIK